MRRVVWAAAAFMLLLSPARAWDFTEQQIKSYDRGDRTYCAYQLDKRYAPASRTEPIPTILMMQCLLDVAYGPEVGFGPTVVPLDEVMRDESRIIADYARKGWVTDGQVDRRIPTLRKRLSVRDKPWYAKDLAFKEDVSDALRLYQRFHGLPPTGRLDDITVRTLDRNRVKLGQGIVPEKKPEAPPAPAAQPDDPAVVALPEVPPSVPAERGGLALFLLVLGVLSVGAAAAAARVFSFNIIAAAQALPLDERRVAAWITAAVSAALLLASILSGPSVEFLVFAFAGFSLLGVSAYYFRIIRGENRFIALKWALKTIVFWIFPVFFTSLTLFGLASLGDPGQRAAAAPALFIGIMSAVAYFASIRSFRDALWLSLCAYEQTRARFGATFTPPDFAQRILSQLPPTSLDIELVVNSLLKDRFYEIPEPPGSWFDFHEHYKYQQTLKTLSFGTPEILEATEKTIVTALLTILPHFPKLTVEPLFFAPLHDPIQAIIDFYQVLAAPRATEWGVLDWLHDIMWRNIEEMRSVRHALTEDAALDILLKDTPLQSLFEARVPYVLQVSTALWYAHTHICAPTGAFKTQLTQTLILHLVLLFKEPSFMVIDSQGPILELLERKFGTQLQGSVLNIHPHSHPVGINPFDIDFASMTEAERGKRITEVADLFVGLFATGSSELSDKMRTLFDQMVRLFLIGIPAVRKRPATMRDMDEFMDCQHPWEKYKQELEHLDDRRRLFFSKHNYGSYSETRTQVHQRLYSVLRDPAIEKMLCAERNELDISRYLDAPGLILVNTDSNALGLENSKFLGRVFLLLAQQALMRRTPEPKADPHPAFVVADEAQEYFKADGVIEQIIDQGRKRHFGMILAHHRFSQAPSGLQDALEQLGVHFASEVAPADLARLAMVLRTSPAFLLAQRTQKVGQDEKPRWIDYALYYRGLDNAISVRLKHGNLENFDTSSLYQGARARQNGSDREEDRRSRSSPPPQDPPSHKDVEWTHTISPLKAKSGCTIKGFKMPDGKVADIVITPGTADGTRLRFKGHSGQGGDFYLKIHVPKMPEQSDSEDMDTGSAPWPC